MKILANDPESSIAQARIDRRGHDGISLSQLVLETGWTPRNVEARLAEAVRQAQVFRFGDRFIHSAALADLKLLMMNAVARFHRDNPLVAGIGKEELRERVEASAEAFAAAIDVLVREQKLVVAGEVVHLPGRGVVMKDEEAESKKSIEAAFAAAGLKAPALKDVLAGLKVDKARAQKIVTLLLRDKVLIKISEDLVFHRIALDDLRQRLLSEKTKSPKINVARFKDLTGVSRKYAIPLLEYFDREHVTRRVGEDREIL